MPEPVQKTAITQHTKRIIAHTPVSIAAIAARAADDMWPIATGGAAAGGGGSMLLGAGARVAVTRLGANMAAFFRGGITARGEA